jgi:SAM-dependent methyltransferase
MNTTILPVSPEALARFEQVYAEADAAHDRARIPWDNGRASPALVRWLDHEAPSLLRCGARVAVVGCGLGHDARELMQRGFEVTAFDVSPTAVKWAKSLDPANAPCYFRADVLQPPPRWLQRFDLVVEVNTLQSVPPEFQPALFDAIARLVGMNGLLLVVCRAAEMTPNSDESPPWAITEASLREMASMSGLEAERLDAFVDAEQPSKHRMRALFHRA